MRRNETQRRKKAAPNKFNKVFDNANRRVRGLWVRNGIYYSQVRAGKWRGRVALEHAQSVPEATTAAQVLKSEIQAGTFKPPQPKGAQTAENGAQKKGSPDSTLTEAITAYEADTRALKTKDPKTLKHEGCAGRRWTEFAGNKKLSEVDAKLLKDFTKHRRKTVGTRSVNTNVLFLHHVLDWCVVEGWLPRFPDAWRWKDLPEDPAAVRLLTVEEIEFIAGANLWTPEQLALIKQPHTKVLRELDAASGRRFQDYVKLLAWSGGREQETCKQKWSNVDWKVGLKFPGQVAKKGAGRPSPDRWVHWNPRLEAHLRDMETRRDPTTDYMSPGVMATGRRTTPSGNRHCYCVCQ